MNKRNHEQPVDTETQREIEAAFEGDNLTGALSQTQSQIEEIDQKVLSGEEPTGLDSAATKGLVRAHKFLLSLSESGEEPHTVKIKNR